MTEMQLRVLHATDVSFAIAAVLGEHANGLSNEKLLDFCVEGPLRDILAADYENVMDFNHALSEKRVRLTTVCIDGSLPDFLWKVADKRVCLELQGIPGEAAVLTMRVLGRQ